MTYNREPLESGEADHSIKWAVYRDYEYDIEREFHLIATRGTGRYIKVDHICDDQDEFESALGSSDILYRRPLFMMVHSGVSISLGGYSDPWDSGQCGFACVTTGIANTFGLKAEDYESFLERAVEQYNAVLTGNVVGYEITRDNKCDACKHVSSDCLESMWGFVMTKGWGSINEFVKDEVLAQVNYFVDQYEEAEHATKNTIVGAD